MYNTDNPANCPALYNNIMIVRKQGYSGRYIQLFYCINEDRFLVRHFGGESWNNWHEVSMDFPTFYKNYSDLASLASALGVSTPIVLRMAAQSATTEIAGAKAYWETLPTDFPVYATLFLSATQGSNCFVTIYKESSYGRIEIMAVSTGTKVVWKKGYSDSDFVLVS